MRHKFFDNKTGAPVAEQDALDGSDHIKDGITMRTSVMLMDGAPVPVTDQQKETQRDARKAALSDAWRNPADQFAAPTVDAAAAARGDHYERRDRRLETAWQH